jgi:hypothetical protein
MKVKELIEFLSRCRPDLEVILQKDAEGNGYSPLEGADSDAVYVPDTTYSGRIYSLTWTATDACLTESTWEQLKEQPRCVVLFPVN